MEKASKNKPVNTVKKDKKMVKSEIQSMKQETMFTSDTEEKATPGGIVNMEDVYKTPTENQTLAPVNTDIEEITEEEVFNDNFEEPEEDDEPIDIDEPDTEESKFTLNTKDQAEFYVKFFDNLQTPFFKMFLRKKIFTQAEIKILKKVVAKKKAGFNPGDLTDEEKALDRKLDNYLFDASNIPFTNDEKNQLITPLEVCLKKWGKDLPPEMFLLMALSSIMGQRATLVFLD